jgi:hypothetical protein
MQNVWRILVASLALCLIPLSVRAGDFEGILHMSLIHQSTNSTSTMEWYLKGEKARVEMFRGEGLKNVMIVNAQTRTMQMAMAGQKTYMELSLGGERGEHLTDALEKQVVERTGKMDKIAGYSCEIWRITDKESNRLKNDICVGKGFGKAASFWVDPKEMKRSSQPSWVKQLVDEGGFGLRSIHYDDAGKESSRMEVTSIERKALDVGLFSFPTDWVKQDMAGMQDRMKAMREQKQPGSEDISKMMEQMKKHKSETSGAGAASGEGAESQPDVKDLMKQLGEMMKKPQSTQGGQ